MRRQFALLSALLASAIGACGGGERPVDTVILVSIDTLRADHLGFHGYARATSPFLDRLAAESVVFEQAIAQAPWTAPSHATMLTSLYPSVLGMGRFDAPGSIAAAVPTLAEVLRDAGFRTHAVVAGGYLSSAIGFDQGFDIYDERGFDATSMVDKALDRVRMALPGEPLFLFLHTYDVHKYKNPGGAAARLIEPYDGPLARPNVPVADLLQNVKNKDAARALDAADRRHVVDLYDASIAAVDAQLERLWRELGSMDRLDRTLIVVTADHGEEFWEHGGSGHGYTLHDENLRVPLVLRHPGLAPARVAEQVRLLDVAPTIAGLCGAAIPSAWQGVDLRAAASPLPFLPAFAEHAHVPMKAVRAPDAKLVVLLPGPAAQFFSLAHDPMETTNLLRGPIRDGEPRALLAALRSWASDNLSRDGLQGGAATLGATTIEQLAELGYAGAPPGTSATGQGDADPANDLRFWIRQFDALK